MITNFELEKFLNNYLSCQDFEDYCPNGLQVEGKTAIKKIVTGVTACLDLIKAAVEFDADALIVHHGYFWKNEAQPIVGMKYRRISTLLQNNINLYAYHLPLDQHNVIGNNAKLAAMLSIKDDDPTTNNLLRTGKLANPLNANEFSAQIESALKRKPTHISATEKPSIKKIAWCTGGAQSFIDQAVDLKMDAYISGEISEQTTHIARENNLHYFAIGHHASEKWGVKALGEMLAREKGLDVKFIDIDNPA